MTPNLTPKEKEEHIAKHKENRKKQLAHKIQHIQKIRTMMQKKIDKAQAELDELNKEE